MRDQTLRVAAAAVRMPNGITPSTRIEATLEFDVADERAAHGQALRTDGGQCHRERHVSAVIQGWVGDLRHIILDGAFGLRSVTNTSGYL